MWIDTHCHPFSKPLNKSLDAALARAKKADVGKMIVVGYDVESNRKALEMAEEFDFMFATLGVHPCDAPELSEDEFSWIRKTAASNDKVVAIGETGLDYHHMSHFKEVQEEAFRMQIRLAKELSLPLIVHSRDAAEDTLQVLEEEKAEKVVLHCFTYGLDVAKKAWDAGYYTSFSGVVTYPQAKDLQEAAKEAPLDLILLETDCPYLAPQSIRGKLNEMAYVVEVGEKVAQLKGMEAIELAEITTRNAEGLFF